MRFHGLSMSLLLLRRVMLALDFPPPGDELPHGLFFVTVKSYAALKYVNLVCYILYAKMLLTRSITQLLAAALLFASPFVAQSASTREAFLKLIDRPRTPLAPDITQLADTDGFEQLHFTYAADSRNR